MLDNHPKWSVNIRVGAPWAEAIAAQSAIIKDSLDLGNGMECFDVCPKLSTVAFHDQEVVIINNLKTEKHFWILGKICVETLYLKNYIFE